ncbi:MAG: hypothetical protein II998_12515 [Clostridia bacterium]|nr:hypothetical protein [Clostridia bacterium]
MENGKVFIWMQLLGFNRDDEDRGAKRFLEQTGFIPDGACGLVFHSDFFHQHRGMDEEYVLHPDNCAYYGIPRNVERERQPWTNYDLRELANNLEKNGTHLYASIFGSNLHNKFHDEWITHHPEISRQGKSGFGSEPGTVFALKRFKDGTYYEDFFIDKVCQALEDYNLKGIHLADAFCPPEGGMLHKMEYSTDFIEQFIEHTGVVLPDDVMATMGDDSAQAEEKRADYIYSNLREEYVEFNSWRWEGFFKKLCSRVHAIGKEVMALAMYCTDPFETLYCIGIDLRKIVNAGVDRITANILPASCGIVNSDKCPYYFHRYMAIAPTTAAYLPKGHLISMLGVQDATEEWSMMHHAPCHHERDMYTMMSYQMIDGDGINRALGGYFLCLGDGLSRQDWDWERERLEIGLSAKAVKTFSPAMYWSDFAFDAMLHEYIHTRRWIPFKLFYELGKSGTHLGATVRREGLCNYSGVLVVPNFDMLSCDEQNDIISYDRGPVFATASPDFDCEKFGIKPSIVFNDKFSNYPMTAFAFGCDVSEEIKAQIEELISVDDNTQNLPDDVVNIEEPTFTLFDTLVFQKVTQGFIDAMALLVKTMIDCPFTIDKPNIVLGMADGAYRTYIFNDVDHKYHRAFVKAKSDFEFEDAKTISKFPVLPPRWMDVSTNQQVYLYGDEVEVKKGFEVKLAPAGVTIVDIYMK